MQEKKQIGREKLNRKKERSADPGERPGPPLFLDQTEETAPPPSPPLSQGLDRALTLISFVVVLIFVVIGRIKINVTEIFQVSTVSPVCQQKLKDLTSG